MFSPSAMSRSMAGMPAGVAGTLIIRLGRSTLPQRSLAAAIVASVSSARSGATSRLMKPSPPPVLSWTAPRVSAALRMSATASSTKRSSAEVTPALTSSRSCASY